MAQPKVEQIFEQAVQHHSAGRLAEAQRLYRQIVTRKPNHAAALHSLGIIEIQTRRPEQAVELIRRALSYKSDYPEALNNLGTALRSLGKVEDAIEAYRGALRLRCTYPEALNNLGVARKQLGELDAAIDSYRQAIAQKPEYADAFYNLGNALVAAGRVEPAIDAYLQAIHHRPAYAQAHSNLANALQIVGRLEDAVTAARCALSIRSPYPQATVNLGSALQAQGLVDDAIAHYREALALEPDFAEAHRNLAFARLARGEFAEGWREYEWRWKCEDFPSPRRDFSQPLWAGDPLDGRTILVYAEQGLGDAIQMARFLPLVAERGGRVIVECQRSLLGLMRAVRGVADVVCAGDPLPPFDRVAPLMSLPLLLGNTLETLPRHVPYFSIDAQRVAAWREKLAAYPGLKVGVVWKGKAKPTPLRSCSLSDLAPLGSVPGVTLLSLQVGEGVDELTSPPAGLNLVDVADGFTDFVETAACMMNLDGVITIDTSTAHLAGALGRRTFTLLPVSADWRWMIARSDSPWYPTMKLFRQTSVRNWREAVAAIKIELTPLSSGNCDPSGGV